MSFAFEPERRALDSRAGGIPCENSSAQLSTTVGATLLLSWPHGRSKTHPILAIGSPAPNFELPGVDGAIHKLSDYSASPVLVVIFICNHCPDRTNV